MPSLIPSRIVLRHSNVQGEKPTESDLLPGEVYLNIPDNKLYYKNRDSITPIIEIDLNTSNDLTHVRDVSLSPEGNLIAVYSDNETKSLGSVVGPPGRGLAIDGIVDYVDQLPDASTIPPIPNILNKNGTLFIVRLGDNISTPFDPAGPRIYAYTSADGGSWDELEGATVAAGVAGPRGNTILSGTDDSPSNLIGIDGDYYLDTVNYVLFGPKSAGAWPLTGVNIQGPVGADGAVTAESLEQLLDDLGLGPTDIVPVVGLQLSDTGAVTLDSGTLGLNSSGDLIVHNGLSNGDDLPAIKGGATISTQVGSFIANQSVINNNGEFVSKIAEWYIPYNWISNFGNSFNISGKIILKFGNIPNQTFVLPSDGIYFCLVIGDNDFSFDYTIAVGALYWPFPYTDTYTPYTSHSHNTADGNTIFKIESDLNINVTTEAAIPGEIAINSQLVGGLVNTIFKNTQGDFPLYSNTYINEWLDSNDGSFQQNVQVLPEPVAENELVKVAAYIVSIDNSDVVFSILDCASVLHLSKTNKYETL